MIFGSCVTNGLGQVVEERSCNLQDMPSMQRDGFGNETAYQYTLDGQIREAKRGKKENSPYKVLQSYEYNARGQITGITDGNGERIDYRLDTWGRITGVGFSDGVTEGYEYTPSGQVSRTINGNGGSIQYRYNSLGKVRERIDQTGDVETFRYDEEGNLSLHIDRDGRRISRTYNVFGNLICEKAVDENGENPVVTTCRYDSLGRLTHAVCNGHSYEYIYNDQGRLKEKRSGGRRLISYTYDRAGKITEITDPAGVTTHYEYDILGRTSRISSPGGMEVRYRYDCLDRLEQIRYGNGIRTSYQYDADGSVSHLETRMGSDILLSFRYQYDGNGNRLMKTGIQGPATDGSSALDITYQYDVRGQLLEENRKDAVFRYSYDAVGNRIRKEETGENRNIETVYFYNEKNQLIHTEEFLEDGNRRRNTFTYSKQGSILREETESGISRYFYNSKNQQIRVERADGQIQENRYDAEGLRHEMRENGKLLRFVYQNGELLYEKGGDKETASCHLGAGIEAVRRGQRTYYYHPDEQLSTALITDETGTIKNQYRYDAFGAGLEASEELPNRIRYTGQQYDEVTEQYYLRARYYNPILGRFLQEDVCQGDGLNLYAYCRNNPVVYWDPSGYKEVSNASSEVMDIMQRTTQNTTYGKVGEVPRKDNFASWFNKLSVDELSILMADKKYGAGTGRTRTETANYGITNQLRHGGSDHEWLPVSRCVIAKKWGVSAEQIRAWVTSTDSTIFIYTDKNGKIIADLHGYGPSGRAHNELFKMMESSDSLEAYKKKLNSWADEHLIVEVEIDGNKKYLDGREGLPEDLQVRDKPCDKR